MIYYVNANAGKSGDGSSSYPFKAIQEAAERAQPGDVVQVAPGIYHEYVNPKYGGKEDARIVYRSEIPGAAVITGAERVDFWEQVEGNVWKACIPNGLFGNYNPYTTLISGDWFIASFIAHTGEVYLNGRSMYEVTSLREVEEPKVYELSWDPDFTVYTWYTEQDSVKDETILYANFQGNDPNVENVEISVRRRCFFPDQEGRGYITLSGFTIKQAATQWAPPTAFQDGMIGPHWSKGWIIEDCEISESKCSGISLGKYLMPDNDNKWLHWKLKDGTQTERQVICRAQAEGWSKDTVGSHIIRRCNIHDCGQTGIVGHMGGVFSLIEDNHIHHINNKQNLAGAEIGGIKMHAAIDVIYRRNHIHHCTRGIWLDWQAQGTRVTQNLLHDNTLPVTTTTEAENGTRVGEDVFIEVSHGPTLIDNNILLSDCAVRLCCQGVSIVHNLIAGSFVAVGQGVGNGAPGLASPRYTPYHFPHRTEVADFMTILHGDCRFFNNIFVQKPIRPGMAELSRMFEGNTWADLNMIVGTEPYNDYPTEEEYLALFEGYCGMGPAPTDRYYVKLPVWTGGNLFLAGAKPCKREQAYQEAKNADVKLVLREEEGRVFLTTNLGEYLEENSVGVISTKTLGKAFEPEQYFENPDGSEIIFNEDYFGEHRAARTIPGPFAGKIAEAQVF